MRELISALFAVRGRDREELWRATPRWERLTVMREATLAQWQALSLGNPGYDADEVGAWHALVSRARVLERARDGWRAQYSACINDALDEHPFDPAAAESLLRVLEPGLDVDVTKFQVTFLHSDVRLWSARTNLLTLDDMPREITKKQREGFNVFVTINAFEEGSVLRRAQDCTRVRSFFLDIDRKYDGELPRDSLELFPPDLVVESGGGWHVYYGILESDPVARNTHKWSHIEQALVKHFRADEKAMDVSRILRMPGTLNLKDPTNPRPCAIEYTRDKALRPDIGDRLVSAFELELTPQRASVSRAAGIDADGASNSALAAVLDAAREQDLRPDKQRDPGETRWLMHCPNPDHEDRNPSCVLLVEKDGGLRMFCRSKCTDARTGDFLEMLGLPWWLRLGPTGTHAPGRVATAQSQRPGPARVQPKTRTGVSRLRHE